MKFKRITFIFQSPLDKKLTYQGQEVVQEDILRADVDGIREKVRKELGKVIRGVNMVRIMSPAVFDTFKFHVMNMEMTFSMLVSFEKKNDTTYEFCYPFDVNALITVKDFASRLGPFRKFAIDRLKSEDLQILKVLREKELIEAFSKFTCKEMMLSQDEYHIVADEFESDPEGDTVGSKEAQLAGETGGSGIQGQGAKVEPSPPADQPKYDPGNTEGKPDRAAVQ